MCGCFFLTFASSHLLCIFKANLFETIRINTQRTDFCVQYLQNHITYTPWYRTVWCNVSGKLNGREFEIEYINAFAVKCNLRDSTAPKIVHLQKILYTGVVTRNAVDHPIHSSLPRVLRWSPAHISQCQYEWNGMYQLFRIGTWKHHIESTICMQIYITCGACVHSVKATTKIFAIVASQFVLVRIEYIRMNRMDEIRTISGLTENVYALFCTYIIGARMYVEINVWPFTSTCTCAHLTANYVSYLPYIRLQLYCM